MPHYERHIFICTNRRAPDNPKGSCADKGSEQLKDMLKRELHARGLKQTMRANAAGCLDQCQYGPAIVVYPEGVWYGGVTAADIPELIEKHLLGGEVVERLRIKDNDAPAGG